MAVGTLVGALVQDTTTTTGTGAITLAGVVPAGAAPGSTTFATQFGTTPQVFPGNTFYVITDGANFEIGLGTFNGSTTLTRDYILGSYTGSPSLSTQTTNGDHVNFASGTKNVFSNVNLFGTTVAAWQRIPDDNAANIFQAVMSGTFTATINAGTATATGTVRFKISNEGIAYLQIPSISVAAIGTTLTMTGIPAFLANVGVATVVQCLVIGTAAGGVTVPGFGSLAVPASPTTTGTITFSQYTAAAFPAVFTAVFTNAVVNGITAQVLSYPLF